MIVRLLLGLALSLAASWLVFALMLLLAARRGRGGLASQLPRLLPDTIRLLRRLLRDPRTPKGARWRLLLALAYSSQPFNLIPDFLPVVGYLDNIIVTLWAVRSTIRLAGPHAVTAHWPGTPEGLVCLYRMMRLGDAESPNDHGDRGTGRTVRDEGGGQTRTATSMTEAK